MAEQRTVVAICTPIYDCMSNQTRRGLMHLKMPRERYSGFMHGETHVLEPPHAGYEIPDARRLLTQMALEIPGLTHVLWVDDDMAFPTHALERLLSWDLDIVGGLCHSRHPPYHPILGRKMDPSWNLGEGAYGFCYDYPPDARFEVDVTGAAFLLVRADVFRKMGTEDGWWDKIEGQSEDFSFCMRAASLGYKIYVDTGLEIGHVARGGDGIVLTAKTAAALRPFQWERWNPVLTRENVLAGKPRASIVIPTYNQDPRRLRAAVLSAIGQTVPVEVIVVDDGTNEYALLRGDEQTGERASDHPNAQMFSEKCAFVRRLPASVKLVRHTQNRGIAAALNTGIAHMTTDWFCWLSSDDLLDPRKVEYQQAALEQAGARCGFHGYTVLDGAGQDFKRVAALPEWRTLGEQAFMLGQACLINGSTVMIHRSVLDQVGGFDVDFRYGQDWEMWCRVARAGFLWYKTAEILGVRCEGGNLSEAIEADSVLTAARDAEDARIRERYAVKCPGCGR